MQRKKGFALSWFFAPYIGSADMDFYKRIKGTDLDYYVTYLMRDNKDESVLNYGQKAGIERVEISTDFKNPRGRLARDEYERVSLAHYSAINASFDFIISHSNEIPSHAVAYKAKQMTPDKPWIAYFGDLFRANPYVKYIPGYPLVEEDAKTELDTLANADLVILNNEYQKELMFSGQAARFADKAVVIPHAFDPAMYKPGITPPVDNVTTFAHLGTLYHTKRVAKPIFDAVDRLLSIYPEYRGRFCFEFYGGGLAHDDMMAYVNMKNKDHVRILGNVGYIESLEVMQRSDVLVLIDGIFNIKEDGIDCNPFLAGKLMDYMGAGRPIMAVTMEKGPSADILKASGNIIASEQPDRIAYVIKRYIDGSVNVDGSNYINYSIENISQQMERAIRGVIK